MMRRAGLSELDVLRNATSRSGAVLGVANVGRLRPGAPADVVVVEGNPVRDLTRVASVPTLLLVRGHARDRPRSTDPSSGSAVLLDARVPGTKPCPERTWPIRRRRARLASTRGRHSARRAPRRPESGPARGCAPRRRAAPRRRRRRLGEDAGPHASRRSPDPRARREAERDPRDHVHEQGRGGDAGAAREDARPHRARDLDPHLPRGLRADPAPRGGAARLPLDVHDLRPGRPGARREGLPRGAREGPEAVHAARDPRPDLQGEEPADLA